MWENENAAGLPMYQPTAPGPWSSSVRPSRSAMSAIAVSHETRSNSPSAVRRSGWVTRSGSFWISAIAIPFGQA